MPLDPLTLPTPRDYGYLGGQPLPQTQVTLPQVQTPYDVQQTLAPYQQQIKVPDVVLAMYRGNKDKSVLAQVLYAANGQNSTLTGVSPQYAQSLLQQWGFPSDMNAWTADQWQAALDTNAQSPDPLTLLGY